MGSGVTVAVIDTGVDYAHPELAASIWHNSGEIAGNGVDDDGNGFVDDIRGWDFANDDNDPRQDRYARFLQDALEVAARKTLIQDPCPSGLYGWRTAGSSEPGGGLVKWGDPLSGNQFYTLKK